MPNLIWYLILGPAVCWFPSNFKYPIIVIIILEAPKPFIWIRFGLSEKRDAHSIHSRFSMIFPLIWWPWLAKSPWNHPAASWISAPRPTGWTGTVPPPGHGEWPEDHSSTAGVVVLSSITDVVKPKNQPPILEDLYISGGVGDCYFGYGTWWNKRWDFRNGNILGDIAKHATGIPSWHSMAWPYHKKTVWEAQKSILITSVPSVPITWAPNTFVGRAGWHGLHTSVVAMDTAWTSHVSTACV